MFEEEFKKKVKYSKNGIRYCETVGDKCYRLIISEKALF
jgi:hypothetical protein